MSKEFIYIVGFPKSGNTWLTRLVARAANAPVVSGLMRGDIEIASDVNEFIEKETHYRTAKIHFLPEAFKEHVEEHPKRIIYIYRDYRDVLISAFFYFNPRYRNLRFEKLNPLEVGFYNPFNHWRLYKNRKKLLQFAKSYTLEGVPNNSDFGTWEEHYNKWKQYLNEHPSTYSVFTSYENLLSSTEVELKRLFNELNMDYDNELDSIVKDESFTKKKRYFKENNNKELPKGKKMNYRFLRSGKSGDWQKYFNKELNNFILSNNRSLLNKLGYL